MACSKQTRVRVTDDSTPARDSSFRHLTRLVSSSVVKPSTHIQVLQDRTYTKSIVDSACILADLPDGTSPCKGLPPKACKEKCADCVSQSRVSFNHVRAETRSFNEVFGDFTHTCVNGSTEHSYQNLWGPGTDGLDACRSHAYIPLHTPTALELSNALRKITPSVEKFFPTVQIYETLFELRELRKLLDLFKVRKREYNPSGKYLGLQFGYIPLIQTIEDVCTILLTLDNIIDKWNDFATANRVMDFHGTMSSDEGADAFRTDTAVSWATAKVSSYEYKYSWTDVKKVHLYIKPHIIPGDMRFRVLLKSLGIDKPLAGLWELIPFSWLIDYFVNVDDMIARWETGLNSMFRFNVHALGYSVKQTLLTETRHSRLLYDEQLLVTPWNNSSSTFYERTPLPASALRDAIIPTEWGWADGPSGQQWTYVLAVASNFVVKT